MKVNSREYIRVGQDEFLKITKWVFLFILKLNPLLTSLDLLSMIAVNLMSIGQVYVISRIIEKAVDIVQRSDASITMIYPYIIILSGLEILNWGINTLGNYVSTKARNTTQPAVTGKFIAKLRDLGIQTLENPDLNNKVTRADEYLSNVYTYNKEIFRAINRGTKVLVTAIIISQKVPILIPLVALITIPKVLLDRKYRSLLYKFDYEQTELARISHQNLLVLRRTKELTEVMLKNAWRFFHDKWFSYRMMYAREYLKIILGSNLTEGGASSAAQIIIYMSYIPIFLLYLTKKIGIGTVTFQIQMLRDFQNNLEGALYSINQLYEYSLRTKDIHDIFHMEADYPDGKIDLPKLDHGPKMHLDKVSFKYPRTDTFVLNNVTLKIESGEKVAIVGRNGSGKTTLVKLLSRIYPVTKGTILINDIDINKVKAETLHQNMGVLFQDFNVYECLSIKENIYSGKTDEKIDEVGIRLAAQAADATEFIEKLPNKWDQLLSERLTGGIRLSFGQWQKIAIARFFYRNSPLVIFDEPTASIDAVSEYNIFNRIYEFFKDKTVIIISHRFSTVRNADRIIVLDEGKIIEEGTHEELLAKKGAYEKAFMLQASGYTTSIV